MSQNVELKALAANLDDHNLVGGAGVQLRGDAWQRSLSWYLNVWARHAFAGSARTIETTGADPVSAIPVFSPIAAATRTYGRVVGGVSARITNAVSLSIEAERVFADTGASTATVDGAFHLWF